MIVDEVIVNEMNSRQNDRGRSDFVEDQFVDKIIFDEVNATK